MPGEIKFSFNGKGKGDRYSALTITATIVTRDGYKIDVNDGLCSEHK
jgi:hypothetical protein